MDGYVKVLKSSNVQPVKRQANASASASRPARVKPNQNTPPVDVKGKGKAIEISDDEDEDEIVEISPPRPTNAKGSSSRVDAAKQTKHLLKTLKDVANPITHSSAEQRYDYVSSCCTGHERRDGSHPGGYQASRSRKLMEQERAKGTGAREEASTVMKGVRAYFGFCDDNTDIELRRIISLAGGSSTYAQAAATHIITSQWLSGSKTDKLLTTRSKKNIHVVSPEWLTDSIAKGKRQSEWRYSKVENRLQRSVLDGFLKAK
ncbi:hypothetical protein FRC00_009379 [Tulasnella sp. 408]|nr:hypothetical protein FRC00_009379 [Tulasnella sp. 408]